MLMYSQNNPYWKNIKLGNSNLTIGGYGCKLTSLSWMIQKTPDVVNELLKKGGAFSGALLIDQKCAEVLGLEYHGTSTTPPDYMCVAECIWSPTNKSQHFIIYEKGHILDSWDGLKKSVDIHPIKNYRLFKVKQTPPVSIPAPVEKIQTSPTPEIVSIQPQIVTNLPSEPVVPITAENSVTDVVVPNTDTPQPILEDIAQVIADNQEVTPTKDLATLIYNFFKSVYNLLIIKFRK